MLTESLTEESPTNTVKPELAIAKHPSDKQLAANRRNACRSTGPRTEAGKMRARRNSTKHGLFLKVIPSYEKPGMAGQKEYKELAAQLQADLRPKTQLGTIALEQLCVQLYRLNYLQTMESTILQTGYDRASSAPLLTDEEIMSSTGGKTADQLEYEIKLLTELQAGLRSGKLPILPQEFIEHTAKSAWHTIDCYASSRDESTQQLNRIDTALATELISEEKESLLEERKSVEKDLQQMSWTGPADCGVTSLEETIAVLKGERVVSSDQASELSGLIGRDRMNLQNKLELFIRNKRALTEARVECATRFLGVIPKLTLFAQYSSTIWRTIERCIKILREQGVNFDGKTIDLGSFLQK